MLEMVFAKANSKLSAYYDSKLVRPELQAIGISLRLKLQQDCATVKRLTGADELLADQAWVKKSIGLRSIYTEPLNMLQAALLQRNREQENPLVEQAILVTIAGVSAGMRNTG